MKKVAIIDDNRELATSIYEHIELEYDIESHIFSSSQQYTNYIAEENTEWDIIFMDYNLEEDVNGIELSEKILTEGFKGIIIFVTGEGGFVLRTKLKLSSVKDYEYIEKGSKMFEEIDRILSKKGL